MVARRFQDEKIALICALFAYGNAKAIVKFLQSLDFELLQRDEKEIMKISAYYRFQKPLDVANIFLTLSRAHNLEEHFWQGYREQESVMDGLRSLLEYLRSLNSYRSYGYDFLLGKPPPKGKFKGVSPYKRWHMFLRWMVRKDRLDMGLWQRISPRKLIIPLDTHTFRVGRVLGLLQRKRYDLEAALELTENLRTLNSDDPVKYDFALYRLGQRNLV